LAKAQKESAIAPGIRAIRDHVRPFLAIQVCVILVAVAYYKWPAFAAFAEGLGKVKVAGGYVFVVVATGFAGAILPEVFKALTKDTRRLPVGELFYNFAVFGLNGILVDVFYRGLGTMFGEEPTVANVTIKVLVDQLLGSPLLFTPYFLTMILLYKSGFNLAKMRESLREESFLRRIWPVLITSWAYWFPALFGVYAMPKDLQFVLFLFIEAAWSLLLIHVARGHD
jgi:hypothetical protein